MPVSGKLIQWLMSIGGGFLIAVETSIPFFVPCLLFTGLDVYSAYDLGRRLHKKWPERFDGKFKSEYKFRIMKTMILVFVAIILGSYVDQLMLDNSNEAVRVAMWVFIVYQGWSILENWSSENDNKLAKALQRIMVNKVERHTGVELKDIFRSEKSVWRRSRRDSVRNHKMYKNKNHTNYKEMGGVK